MKNIRKELQIVSKLCETILQWRLERSETLGEHLKSARKKIRTMRQHNSFEEGIIEMLVSKENFQIKEKLMKAFEEDPKLKQPLRIQIEITAILKRNCEIYNEELWEFGIFLEKEKQERNFDSTEGSVHLMEHILRHLEYSSLLSLSKEQRNRFIVNYKVSLIKNEKELIPTKYENMSSFEATVARESGASFRKIISKFYYNNSKVEESLKEIIMERSLENSGSSKRNSSNSTEESMRVSFYEHYDSELDITVLSNEEINENEDVLEDDEFQLLIEENPQEDQLFVNENAALFEKLEQLHYF